MSIFLPPNVWVGDQDAIIDQAAQSSTGVSGKADGYCPIVIGNLKRFKYIW